MSYILIAEDDPFIQLLVIRKLQGAGYEVRAYSNGDDALVAALKDPPRLMLLDVMMPGRNGLAVCREVKTQMGAKAPPVIIASAAGQSSDIDAARAAGADDYMIKPFPPNELLAHIEALL
jgi:two-component system phosphate regulon response regulator PhoB